MAGENRYSNVRGTSAVEFGIGAATPTTGIDISNSAQGVTIQNLASGARATVRAKDPRVGGTAAISTDCVTSQTAAINAMSGRWGHFSAPFASFATPCQGNLRLDAPGVVVGAGVPVFSMADAMDAVNGPYTRMSLVGAASNWFGFTGSPGAIFDYDQGGPRSAKAFFRMAAPSYADLSFFIGGFGGANALLSSGPDPSAAAMTGCAAFVKLAADPNWNAFVRITGSAVPTKIDMGVPAVAGTVYLFLLEELSPATASFSIYSTAGALLSSVTIPHFDIFTVSYKLCSGAFTAVAAARDIDYYNGMLAQIESWDS